MKKETTELLLKKAAEARGASYSPYSGFSVGAALLLSDGSIYTGANIENSSYTPTVCAERVAFFSALHDGHRDFRAIAIVGGKGEPAGLCYPCGVCLQVMSEFCEDDFEIILSDGVESLTLTLDELLPRRFTLKK
jgi:cytidine deaminase